MIDRALTLLVQELQKSKHAAVSRPRAARSSSSSRYVPAAIRREVWRRDGGQCAFMGEGGRCTERGLLEYHHRVPFADEGATNVENLELRCRAPMLSKPNDGSAVTSSVRRLHRSASVTAGSGPSGCARTCRPRRIYSIRNVPAIFTGAAWRAGRYTALTALTNNTATPIARWLRRVVPRTSNR